MKLVDTAKIFYIRKFGDSRGMLCVADGKKDMPVEIRRVFWMYGVPEGESRGAHAHKECHQVLVAVAGSFDVELKDDENTRTVTLDSPDKALHIPPGVWATEMNFKPGTVCMVMASDEFVEPDYICDFEEYKEFIKQWKSR